MLLNRGRLVKGKCFTNHLDAGNPATTAKAYNAQGADEILLLDIQASKIGSEPDFKTLMSVANECFIPLTVGGGVTSSEIATKCFDSGADKIFLNTTALDNPGLIEKIAGRFGSQSVMLGVDLYENEHGHFLFDHRTNNLVNDSDWKIWVQQSLDKGVGEIRIMSVSKEGQKKGVDMKLFREFKSIANVPLILEGGIGSLEDIDKAFHGGADAIAFGTLLVFSDNNIVKIKSYLSNAGHLLRN